MDELLIKMNEIVKSLNETFEIDPVIVEDGDEEIVSGLKIKSLKNDGKDFIENLFELISAVIENSSEYELAYKQEEGLVIVKKEKEVTFFNEDN